MRSYYFLNTPWFYETPRTPSLYDRKIVLNDRDAQSVACFLQPNDSQVYTKRFYKYESTTLMTQDKDYDYDSPKSAKLWACNVKPGHNAFQ